MKDVIYLRDAQTEAEVEAEIVTPVSEEAALEWTKTWKPKIAAYLSDLQKRKIPVAEWPQDLNWNWEEILRKTRGMLAYDSMGILSDGILEGLMALNTTTKKCQLESQKGNDIVYIELLSTAPWNRKDMTDEVKLRGVGSILVAAATKYSFEVEFKGRIGLHALPQSEAFYRKFPHLTEVGVDPDKKMIYFESTPEEAKKFLHQ